MGKFIADRKMKSVHKLGATNIADVFYDEGLHMGAALEDLPDGCGAIILLKRGTELGCPVVFTRKFIFYEPASKGTRETVVDALKNHYEWDLYDVFGGATELG